MRRYFVRHEGLLSSIVVTENSVRVGELSSLPEVQNYKWSTESAASGRAHVELANSVHTANFAIVQNTIFLSLDGFFYRLSFTDLPPSHGTGAEELFLKAEIPGRIVKVLAKPGDAVAKGQELIVQEAMKMEITLRSPADLLVQSVHVHEGAQVQAEAVLMVFELSQDNTRS